jgi:ferrous iron transport protein B
MSKPITVALAGNPNSGKTTLFNALTGARQHVGNWPGVTVEKKEGTASHAGRSIHVVDLPGTYSLTALSEDEIVARNFVMDGDPDVVVAVVDSANLERNLYLAVQLMEMGVKVVLALNMIDVAQGRGLKIDHRHLSQLLGVPIVTTNGKKEEGVSELLDVVLREVDRPEGEARRQSVTYGHEVEEELSKIKEKLGQGNAGSSNLPTHWLAVKLLEGDAEVETLVEKQYGNNGVLGQVQHSRNHLTEVFGDSPDIAVTDGRYGFIAGAVKESVAVDRVDRLYLSDKVDTILTHRLLGPIIMLLTLYGIYQFTFVGSEPLVGYFEGLFEWLSGAAQGIIPDGLMQSLIVSGIIDGVGGVLGFVPLIAFMFFAIAILEDTGYMARVAFMLDRVLKTFGLHGSSILALMVSGGIAGGCAVPGVMATRTLREPKERLATILVSPLLNCGAKLPVYALLIAAFFPGDKASMMFILTLISWAFVLLCARVLRSTILSGQSAPFVLEMPPYRVPTIKGLLIHTWERTWMYIKKAATVILAVAIVLWAMMTFPGLPDKTVKQFDDRIADLTASFLKQPQVKGVFNSEKDIAAFAEFREKLAGETSEDFGKSNPAFLLLARSLSAEEQKEGRVTSEAKSEQPLASVYTSYLENRQAIEQEKQTAALKHTVGGRLGVALEYVFKPLNFDWRTNIALVGGFAAKEVVVSTLGTAYSLGEVDPEETEISVISSRVNPAGMRSQPLRSSCS